MSSLYALVPRDKVLHFLLMAVIAVVNAAAFLVIREIWPVFVMTHQLATFVAALGVNVGLVKEGCDWMDNRLMASMGLPPLHGVEFFDFLATALGGLVVAAWLVWAGIS